MIKLKFCHIIVKVTNDSEVLTTSKNYLSKHITQVLVSPDTSISSCNFFAFLATVQ